jgi:diacylglycerol kinase (ATP)
MYENIHVVINPAAGKSEPVLSILNQVLKPAGITWDNSITQQAGDCTRLVREAIDRGVDLIAVYGGDGTIMEAANGLIGSEIPLLVLPGGTGNVFSIELGIPQDLQAAIELLLDPQARIRAIDVGRCGERYFLLRVGIGFVAEQINLTSRELRDRYGKLAYFIAALQAVPSAAAAQYHIQVDGEDMDFEGTMCLIENAGNIGISNTSLVPDVSIDDGLLDLIVLRGIDLETALSALSSVTGRETRFENLDHRQGRELTIQADPPQKVVVDGEPFGETPCSIHIHPAAIQVLSTPQEETPSEETPSK